MNQEVQQQQSNFTPIPRTATKNFLFRSRRKKQQKNQNLQNLLGSSVENLRNKDRNEETEEFDSLEVIIEEKILSTGLYGLYVWPSSQLLSWFVFENREIIRGKRILELGAGCGLVGITAALCGAKVILSDSAKNLNCLEQCRKNISLNKLSNSTDCVGITWGSFFHPLTTYKNKFDLILGSDCFFDPVVFEDLVSTVAYLLENNPRAKFLTSYQERSADWSIESLLQKWGLHCKEISNLNEIANSSGLDLVQLTQGHSIHLLEITLKS